MVLSQRQKIEEAKKICLAVFGTLVFSIGVNVFIVPIGLYNGGVCRHRAGRAYSLGRIWAHGFRFD